MRTIRLGVRILWGSGKSVANLEKASRPTGGQDHVEGDSRPVHPSNRSAHAVTPEVKISQQMSSSKFAPLCCSR